MELLDKLLVNAVGYPFKGRNQLIDSVFYDVNSLTPEEQVRLSPLVDREGTILVVPPRNSGREIRHYKNALRFLVQEVDNVRAFAVAGVGSSVLGTAALARNIADAFDFEVAGIVSGYGLGDLVSEALGGWFFYGMIDRIRHGSELLADRLSSPLPENGLVRRTEEPALAAERTAVDPRLVVPGNSDVGTLLDILIATRSLRLLVGHSKGNLLISFVLQHMVRELGGLRHPYYDDLAVVSLGAVVDIPEEFRRRKQFLGQFDLLGRINSQADIPHETVPGAGHHLNPDIPGAMPTAELLRDVPLAAVRERTRRDRSTARGWLDEIPFIEGSSAATLASV